MSRSVNIYQTTVIDQSNNILEIVSFQKGVRLITGAAPFFISTHFHIHVITHSKTLQQIITHNNTHQWQCIQCHAQCQGFAVYCADHKNGIYVLRPVMRYDLMYYIMQLQHNLLICQYCLCYSA